MHLFQAEGNEIPLAQEILYPILISCPILGFSRGNIPSTGIKTSST
jgi:hypothetical protein